MFLFTDSTRQNTAPAGPLSGGKPGGFATPVEIALRGASEKTGTSFSYLMATAKRESGLKPEAKANTSSASGLFQFIEQTWLSLIRSDGANHGLASEATQVSAKSSGRLTVADPAERQRILDLRHDPETSARLAGVLTVKNRDALAKSLGREPGEGDLYIAHFLGSSAAAKLIRLKDSEPGTGAAKLFPDAAEANRPIFFNRDGSARSAGDVYARLVNDFTPGPAVIAPAVATVPAEPPRSGNPFHGLFRSSAAASPVSATVSQAWLPLARTQASGSATGQRPGAIGQPLNLLSFLRARG